MIPTDKAHEAYIRAEHIADAEIEIEKYSVKYTKNSDGVSVDDYACVIAGLILFQSRAELQDFDSLSSDALVARADALALEIAEDEEWQAKREQQAMDRYIRNSR